MEVLIIEPGKKPEVANIEDTLESLRSIITALLKQSIHLMIPSPSFAMKKANLSDFS